MVTIKTTAMVIMGAARAIKTGMECDNAAGLIRSLPACTEIVPDVTMNPAMQKISKTANQKRMNSTRSERPNATLVVKESGGFKARLRQDEGAVRLPSVSARRDTRMRQGRCAIRLRNQVPTAIRITAAAR